MGTMVRTAGPPATGEGSVNPRPRSRRRWRLQPRGLIGLVLAIVVAINLYVLADNAIRLLKMRAAQRELGRRLNDQQSKNRILEQERQWMQSDEFLRDQAHNLGYVSPGEEPSAVAKEDPNAPVPAKKPGLNPELAY